jgi:Flp pilus assembly protein TadD
MMLHRISTKDRAMSIRFRLASCAVPTFLGFLLAGCASQALLDAAASTEKPDQDGLTRVASDVEAQGQIVAALPIYEQAAAASNDPKAQVRLGDAYTRAGKTDQAIKAYRAALAVAPDNPDALLGLGSALVKAGDADGAVVALAKAAPIVNTMTAYNRLGVAQTQTGQFAQAHQSFDTASALAPDDLDIRINVALAAALEGQETKAIDVARSVVTSPGAQARHRRNLMIVYGLLGLVDEGRAAAPKELSANEAKKLLARAMAIRAISDAKARAKALGTIMS